MSAAQGTDWSSRRKGTHPASTFKDPDFCLVKGFLPPQCSTGGSTDAGDMDMQGRFNAVESYRVFVKERHNLSLASEYAIREAFKDKLLENKI